MTLDPMLAEMFKAIPLEVTLPIDWVAQRAMSKSIEPMIIGDSPRTEVASVEPRMIDGPEGPIEVRVYRPLAPGALTLMYVHGGGWTLGDLDGVDHTARYLCEALSTVVVTTSYRLAPENPFPAGFDDTLAAARWVVANVAELGGDADMVAISGDSAGGNLAAAVAVALRNDDRAAGDGGRHSLKAQLLLYPATDLTSEARDNPSRIADGDPGLRAAALGACVEAYVGAADPHDWRISPLRCEDLSDLPPAVVAVLTIDPLRDEAVAYADRLREAGVHAEVVEFSNLTHGFTHLRRIIPAAADATDEVLSRFSDVLARD